MRDPMRSTAALLDQSTGRVPTDHPPMHRSAALLPFAAGALAVGIFIFDTFSPLQFAVAVLYVVVVLIAATRYQRRAVLIAAVGCSALTILSFLLVHGFNIAGTAPYRSLMSLAAVGITAFLAVKNIATTERLKGAERHRTNLARFFSPQRVDQLMEIDTPLSVARYQPAAVLFVDMIGFTTYCSKMAPDAVIAMLRDLLALLSASVFSHHGTIDKFLGDGLLAVFGPPTPSKVDATNAVRCALDMLQSIDRWNEQCHRHGDVAIRVAVGIHYGDVVQGDIGSDKQLELTVIGDTVNIASRVESYCRSLKSAMLVTGALIDSLHLEGSKDLAEVFVDQGEHLLRGRAEPIRLYGVTRA